MESINSHQDPGIVGLLEKENCEDKIRLAVLLRRSQQEFVRSNLQFKGAIS